MKTKELVEIRSREEILATLDEQGTIDGMPFMPEMLQFCGKRFSVAAIAHKTCDTACRTGGRALHHTVHLEGTRCDGSAHGGCEADCNLFWREEWLKPVVDSAPETHRETQPVPAARLSEERLRELTRAPGPSDEPVYRCQATQLFAASRPLPWWDLRQYARDVLSGNHRLGLTLNVLWLAALAHLTRLPFGYRIFRAMYERMHRALTRRPAPRVTGQIPLGSATPRETLDLRPGELVRVRQPTEIAITLNKMNKNRGMWFGPEQEPFCGGTFRVRRRIDRIIEESTGRMLNLRGPCVSLEGVVCLGYYSEKRRLCPRAITPYWRENWLERVESANDGRGAHEPGPVQQRAG